MAIHEHNGSERGLSATLKRWRATMNASDAGPTMIATEVVHLAHNWESHRSEAEGLDCTTWLRRNLGPGRGLPFFRRLQSASEAVGKENARRMHHTALVWLVGSVPEGYRIAILNGVGKTWKTRNAGVCCTLQQVKTIASKTMQKLPSARVCGRCKKLEEQIRALGGVPEE